MNVRARTTSGPRGGFTLIEALIGSLLLISVLAAIVGVQESIGDLNSTSSTSGLMVEKAQRSLDALAYEMRSTLPPFFTLARNDWTIEDRGEEGCRLVGEARFDLKEDAVPMRDKLEGKMGMVLEVFAQAVRTQF